MSKQTGNDCKLSIGSDVAGTIRDASLTVSNSPVDVTARDSGGWREELGGIKEWTISGPMVYLKDDVAMVALRTASLAGTLVTGVLFIFKDLEGFKGDVLVTEMGAAAPLEDAVVVEITLKGVGPVTFEDDVS